MPFLIHGDRQRRVDKRHNLSRQFGRTAIANPLRIAPVNHEACGLERSHMAGHAGLAGTELTHQFAHTVLTPVPHHSQGFETDRF